jgi:MSHA biogenesis protein MshE
MRDKETVEIGLRGALTGHLVLSTLHTNDAISSATRLLDMGSPGYLVASSLKAIIAQRLVRKVCQKCAVEHEPTKEHKIWLSQLDQDLSASTFKKGKGCQRCNFIGYSGRVGVFELLQLNEEMMTALKNDNTAAFTKAAEKGKGFRSLANAALDYAKQGVTSLDEVMRLVEMVEDLDDAPQPQSETAKPTNTSEKAPSAAMENMNLPQSADTGKSEYVDVSASSSIAPKKSDGPSPSGFSLEDID